MHRGLLLIFTCLCQLGLVLSVLTLTDVEVTFSKEYYGPDSYIELSSDYPNTFNMYFDVLKAYPPTAIVNFDCKERDEDGQYTVNIGIKYSVPIKTLRRFKMLLRNKNDIQLDFTEPGRYRKDNLTVSQSSLPDRMKLGDYGCTLIYLPTKNSPNSDAIVTYVGKFLVE